MIRPFSILLLLLLNITARAELTRGPYLQLAHESGVTIVWRSKAAMKNPVVRIWPEKEPRNVKVIEGRSILVRTTGSEAPLSKAPEGTVQYEATISGLPAQSAWRYGVYDGKESLHEPGAAFRFVTHPPIGKASSTRVWVVGDSGTGLVHQRKVHEAMRQYTFESKRDIDLYLHVGDMAYPKGTDDQFQNFFFEPYRRTLRKTVCWASMGNHEGFSSKGKTGVGPFYDAYVSPAGGEAGGIPSGREDFYSFDYGDAHFICLNSHDIERKPGGAMAKWLLRDLAATRARWIISFWHHPPYTKGTHDSDKEVQLVEMREYIMPILEEGGVDLVLSGHSHIYERSMLIDGAYQTPTTAEGVVLDDGDGRPDGDGPYRKSAEVTPHNGTVAVVTGHGGKLGSDTMGMIPLFRSIVLDHGSTILDIEGDTLTGTMLDLNGRERDTFQIVKRGVVKQSVIENPWTPTKVTEERTGDKVKGAVSTIEAAKRARKAGENLQARAIPSASTHLVPPHAKWYYLSGGREPESEMWCRVGLDPEEEGWKLGEAGFGYGDDDDRTVLEGMKNKYTALYIRHEFEIPKGTDLKRLGLVIHYDDAFALYVNGRELFSKEIEKDKNGKATVTAHEAEKAEYFSLADFAGAFKIGRNVIALEGHNVKKSSTDFSLHPYLVLSK